jgi:hypothetical protein
MGDADLAAARRYLQWTMFGIAAAVAILVIDLRLKQAVAGQARVASKLYTDLVVRFGGDRQPEDAAADDHGHGDRGGRGGVGANAPVGTDDDNADRKV